MRIKLIQSNQSEMVSFFHENLNKRIGAVAQTVYTSATQARSARSSAEGASWLRSAEGNRAKDFSKV